MKLSNIGAVFKKEFLSFFNSPVAYIVVTAFLLITGWLFFQQLFLAGQTTMRALFGIIPGLFIFFAPAITMRLIAEERKTGTFSLLLTLPVSCSDIILGKFLAASALLGTALLLTVPYAVTVSQIGPLDWGPVVGGYLGAILMGAAFTAIGMLATSFTSNQVIAFITGFAICFLFSNIDKIAVFVPHRTAAILEYLSMDHHFQNIARGVADMRDIIYYVSVIAACLAFSTFVIRREEWR